MKATRLVEEVVDVKTVELSVAVRYDEEDMPNDFPGRTGDVWNVTIDIDAGKILNWEEHGIEHELHMKVCDQGTYTLKDGLARVLSKIEEDYVPNSLIPGSYGDYIEMKIAADGTIKNWPKNPSFEDFPGFNDEPYTP